MLDGSFRPGQRGRADRIQEQRADPGYYGSAFCFYGCRGKERVCLYRQKILCYNELDYGNGIMEVKSWK
ncbi:MAG: hypothetical protein E7244_21740 [Enterocloster citroniae]|nr:hypothetical protein [Enterocloster citroniae]